MTRTAMRRCVLDAMEGELLVALYHLRYLTTRQLHAVWFAGRTDTACAKRLSRLAGADVLLRVDCPTVDEPVWALGSEGLRQLRALRDGVFPPTQALSPLFLPHHLETNEVFMMLAAGESSWDRLPFLWQGSGVIRFEEMRRDNDGVLHRVRAALRPDAIVTLGHNRSRVFLELDRSTECIREADERRSIARKIKAYNTVLTKGPAQGNGTWYRQAYADNRTPSVAFVLGVQDRRSSKPGLFDRRMDGILQAVHKINPRLPVRCAYLQDVGSVREAMGLPHGPIPQLQETPHVQVSLGAAEARSLAYFYRAAVAQSRGKSPSDPALAAAARDVQSVLQRLGAELRR